MTRLGVLGWPVSHSRSPAMQNAALQALGLSDWRYQRLPVPANLFEETVRALPGVGFVGANVTIPHKQAALELSDSASPAARQIGAANTLSFTHDGTIEAENTDAPGLIDALDWSVEGKRAMVLGAGGSARAAVWALQQAGVAECMIFNRTSQRARELADEFDASAVERPQPADLLVNCTSVGLERSASDSEALNQLALTFDVLGRYSYVVDFVYSPQIDTPLLRCAARAGSRTLDGLEILVAQGALSLQLWTGCTVPRDTMREAARE